MFTTWPVGWAPAPFFSVPKEEASDGLDYDPGYRILSTYATGPPVLSVLLYLLCHSLTTIPELCHRPTRFLSPIIEPKTFCAVAISFSFLILRNHLLGEPS